jgi:hypothetical protein
MAGVVVLEVLTGSMDDGACKTVLLENTVLDGITC